MLFPYMWYNLLLKLIKKKKKAATMKQDGKELNKNVCFTVYFHVQIVDRFLALLTP